jgi:hypothetical protein
MLSLLYQRIMCSKIHLYKHRVLKLKLPVLIGHSVSNNLSVYTIICLSVLVGDSVVE